MSVDPNDIQWDGGAPSQPSNAATTPTPTPTTQPVSHDDIQWDGPPVEPAHSAQPQAPQTQPTQAQSDATQNAPQAQAQAQAQSPDMSHHYAVIRALLASPADDATIKSQIMDYASKNNLIGPTFASDIDNAISYRDRAGRKAAAHDTAFADMAAQKANDQTPITITAPKPRPNGISRPESLVVGALESIPGADRIGAGVQAGLDVINPYNHNSISQNYDKSLAENRALSDQAWNEHPGDYAGGYAAALVPQMLLGTGELDAAAQAPSLAGTVVRGAGYAGGTSLANTRQDLSTEEGWKNAGSQAAVDTALGAGLGLATHGVANVATTRGYGAQGQEILNAAQRLSRGDVQVQPTVQQTGGVISKGLNAAYERMPFIGHPVQTRAVTFDRQAEQAYARTADEAAANVPAQPMTATARDLLNPKVSGSLADYEPSSKALLKPEYDDIDQQAASVIVQPVKTLATLDQAIARQKARFRGEKVDWLPELEDIRNDVAKTGTLPFSDIRDWRTNLRDQLQASLGDKWMNMPPAARRNLEGVLDNVYQSATDDLHRALQVNGLRGTSSKLRFVDAKYAEVANTAKMLRPLLDLSPEQLAPKLEQMAQDRGGDAEQLSQVMRTLSPEQLQNLQASFVHTLGQQQAGKAVTPTGFSLNSFLTRWGGDGVRGGLSNDAKNLLFTGQTRRDLDDLATLARAQRSYYQKWGNPSNTTKTAIGTGEVLSTMGAAGTGALFHASVLVPAVLGYATAHMIAAPGFARAVVNLGKLGGSYVPQFARRMEVLARRNPAAATQFLGLRDAIMGNQHPNSVAVGGAQQPQGDDNFDYWLNQVKDEPEPQPQPEAEEPETPQPDETQ